MPLRDEDAVPLVRLPTDDDRRIMLLPVDEWNLCEVFFSIISGKWPQFVTRLIEPKLPDGLKVVGAPFHDYMNRRFLFRVQHPTFEVVADGMPFPLMAGVNQWVFKTVERDTTEQDAKSVEIVECHGQMVSFRVPSGANAGSIVDIVTKFAEETAPFLVMPVGTGEPTRQHLEAVQAARDAYREVMGRGGDPDQPLIVKGS